MKYHRIILAAALLLLMQPAMAADDNMSSGEMMDYVGYGAVVFILILFLIVFLLLLKAFRLLTKLVYKYEGLTEQQIIGEMKPAGKQKKPKAEVWQKLLSLRPLAEEKELLIAHDYDGIQELDNPIPAWFMYLFYGTIIFAVGYLLTYHVFGLGQLQYQEYKIEMAQADAAKKLYLSKTANKVESAPMRPTRRRCWIWRSRPGRIRAVRSNGA